MTDAWKVPAFLDYVHEPLSPEILDQATSQHRVVGPGGQPAIAYVDTEHEVGGSFDHGYRTLRVDLADGPHWAWITPNHVPAGFRRDGRTVIATAEKAFRLPMDPDCSILVTCTDADADEVRSAARATGFWPGQATDT